MSAIKRWWRTTCHLYAYIRAAEYAPGRVVGFARAARLATWWPEHTGPPGLLARLTIRGCDCEACQFRRITPAKETR